MTAMADAFDRAVQERIAALERSLSAADRLVERLLADLAIARGVPESVIWLGLTGQPGPGTNSNPVRVEKSREQVAPAVRLRITGSHHPHRDSKGTP